MNKRRFVYPFAAALALAAAAPASAEERTCAGALGAITVDNLRVPQGATCTLNGTRVKGTIYVERDATLRASRVRVVGNVQAENAALVIVRSNSSVGGSVQVVQGGGARILMTFVNGDILFDDNEKRLIARDNVIGGNLQAFQNTGSIAISNNESTGTCSARRTHRPPPAVGTS